MVPAADVEGLVTVVVGVGAFFDASGNTNDVASVFEVLYGFCLHLEDGEQGFYNKDVRFASLCLVSS